MSRRLSHLCVFVQAGEQRIIQSLDVGLVAEGSIEVEELCVEQLDIRRRWLVGREGHVLFLHRTVAVDDVCWRGGDGDQELGIGKQYISVLAWQPGQEQQQQSGECCAS